MKISFSTLACPAWSLDRALDAAIELGFDGIELRFIEFDDRLWQRAEFTGAGLQQTKHRLNDASLSVSCLDTSCFFHHPDAEQRQAALEMGQAMIELAAELGAPAIRVFGDRVQPGADLASTRQWIVEGVRALAAFSGPHGVETWLETHGDFARAADTRAVLQEAGPEGTGVIWDPLNSFSEFGEDPAAGLAALGPSLRHTHIKDAVKGGFPWEPALVGTGDFPAAGVVGLLRECGYQGFVSFEWEKRWHPEIPEPEVALPHFMRWMRASLEA